MERVIIFISFIAILQNINMIVRFVKNRNCGYVNDRQKNAIDTSNTILDIDFVKNIAILFEGTTAIYTLIVVIYINNFLFSCFALVYIVYKIRNIINTLYDNKSDTIGEFTKKNIIKGITIMICSILFYIITIYFYFN